MECKSVVPSERLLPQGSRNMNSSKLDIMCLSINKP